MLNYLDLINDLFYSYITVLIMALIVALLFNFIKD